jgi:hypothetical protein
MKQKDEGHVTFESLVPVQIMAIDGTWRRPCLLKVVSETGATLISRRFGARVELEGVLPFALVNGSCLSALRARLGKRRSDRRQLPATPRQANKAEARGLSTGF